MKALALLLLTGCGCSTLPVENLHKTTLRLESASSVCSGTAVGPDLVLTATHCLAKPLLTVNGERVEVVARANGSRDTSVVRIKGATFKHWSRRGAMPRQGDHVFWWGNPQGVADVYREGYVALVQGEQIAVDGTICHGDSGAGIFNMQGEVVAVVSAMSNESGCTFLLAWR